jgi:hypothetical protein
MLRVYNRFRAELDATTLPQELERAAQETHWHLEHESATLKIDRAVRQGDRVLVDVAVANRGGHKLPTAYPSRRAWLHLRIVNGEGRVVFESGAVQPTGMIVGNDNDADPAAYERHHAEISSADQVQIYENIMTDAKDAVTTGLLSGVRYVKDNRLLPKGFDKRTAEPDIAVHGEAAADPDFTSGGDRVRFNVAVPPSGDLLITAELLYQSVGYRWAENLRSRQAVETDRFTRYYDLMRHAITARLAAVEARIPSADADR